MDDKRKWLTWLISAVVIAAVLILAKICAYNSPEAVKRRYYDNVYNNGFAYLADGYYKAAYEEFYKLPYPTSYPDRENLVALCRGLYKLEEGDYYAWDSLCRVKVDETVLLYVPDFEKKKSDAWLLFKKGVEEETAREKEELRTSGIPYVGMPERDIYATSLGAASEKYENFNYETIDGKQYPATKYVWKKYGCIIFTARCCNGQVKNVWDERDNPRNPSGNYGYSSGGGSKSDEPEFDVDFFENAEDFYDHYYDDFIDYYEAEDYFEEHKK